MRMHPAIWIAFFGGAALCAAADPAAQIASFSSFREIPMAELQNGAILGERGSTTHFQRGLSAETCYLVRKPPAEAARFIMAWDPARHPELNVFVCRFFHDAENPGQDPLPLDPSKAAIARLLEQTRRSALERPELHFAAPDIDLIRQRIPASQAEAIRPESAEFARMAGSFWGALLQSRLDVFSKSGIAALPPYELDGVSIPVHGEILSMLNEDPRVKTRFLAILKEKLFPYPSHPPQPDCSYWQVFQSEKTATCCAGAMFAKSFEDGHWQLIDVQFYSANSFLAMISLMEIWPVTVEGREASLVWRKDYVSAVSYTSLRGVEQMAAGALMLKNIKNNIRIFQADALP